jgi:cytochrome-b5 reductase
MGVETITMIAVGVGIAPMFQALHALLNTPGDETQIVLLYGVRTVADVLLRENLESWSSTHSNRFRIIFGVGSRWAGAHFGAKTKDQHIPPPIPAGFESFATGTAELGWIDEDKIRRHAFPPSVDTRVFVCGLPGVYDHLCGPRTVKEIRAGSALHNIGYNEDMVVKF